MITLQQDQSAQPPSTQPQRAADIIRSAQRAQAHWNALKVRERLKSVRLFRKLLARSATELAENVVLPVRRLPAETVAAELMPLADACRFLEREAPRLLAPVNLGRSGRPAWLRGVDVAVRRDPYGVVLVLGTWNYPLLLGGVHTLQALVAGNAVLLKPGTGATPAAHALQFLFQEAGLPEGLLHILPEPPDVAQAVIAEGVDHIVLTGSAETGSRVLKQAAEKITPCTMELSGCDAVFVQADADLDLVARCLAMGLRFNGGATCIAPRRVFVHQSKYGELIERLARPIGVQGTTVHEIRRASQLVQDALRQGARLVSGSLDTEHNPEEPGGAWIVADATPEMALLQSAVMAPVAALVAVRSDEDALIANDRCPFALGASVFGKGGAAVGLAQRVNAGCVVVNDMIVPTADPRVAFGGRKKSGFGVTRGAEGLLAMTRSKSIMVRHGNWRPHLDVPSSDDCALLTDYLLLKYDSRLVARMAAGLRICRMGYHRWRNARREGGKS